MNSPIFEHLNQTVDGTISSDRIFVYDHTSLRTQPENVLRPMAEFLGVNPAGFDAAVQMIKDRVPVIDPQLQAEYEAVADQIQAGQWMAQVSELNSV